MRYAAVVAAMSLCLWAGVASDATACSCAAPGPACFAVTYTDAVFVGRVTASTSEVEFEVEQAFKGVETGRITVQNRPDTCAFNFTIGERYIVYAGRDRTTGELDTSKCSRTRALSDPRTRGDLEYFARGKEHRDENFLTGVVSDVTVDLAVFGASRRPLAGITVTAIPRNGDGGRIRATTTRADGSYEITGLQPGDFDVVATLPPQFEPHQPVTARIDDVIPGKITAIRTCAEADVGARIDGRISGQLLDERNQPLRDVAVQLANPAHARAERPVLRTIDAVTDAQGHYQFRNVGPGQYVLGVNLQTPLRAGTLNRRRYYTGRSATPTSTATSTAASASATVIELTTGERRQLPPFRLSPLPANRLITIAVQAPTNDVARETAIFLTGATREPVARSNDPLSLRLPFGASYVIEAVAPKGYRIIQPAGVRIAPEETGKTIAFRVERVETP